MRERRERANGRKRDGENERLVQRKQGGEGTHAVSKTQQHKRLDLRTQLVWVVALWHIKVGEAVEEIASGWVNIGACAEEDMKVRAPTT